MLLPVFLLISKIKEMKLTRTIMLLVLLVMALTSVWSTANGMYDITFTILFGCTFVIVKISQYEAAKEREAEERRTRDLLNN